MSSYETLEAKAAQQGIYTFGDALRLMNASGADVFGGMWDEDMEDERLYDCDAARRLLEGLEGSGLL